MIADVGGIDVFYWSRRRPRLPGRLGRAAAHRLGWYRHEDNFGDRLGEVVVRRLWTELGRPRAATGARLLGVGSVLHFAEPGDVVWGSGINGKAAPDPRRIAGLDVRAVRGPRTAAALRGFGLEVPDVFGDPGLLLADLDPRLRRWRAAPEHDLTIVPNLNDDPAAFAGRPDAISPLRPLDEVLERIARSRRVIASSLHGVVIAESLGIPVVLLAPGGEPMFKYDDYFGGTGRDPQTPAPDLGAALDADAIAEPPDWDPARLRRAFPADLWGAERA